MLARKYPPIRPANAPSSDSFRRACPTPVPVARDRARLRARTGMNLARSSGVQLHPTSLPGGRLGADAYAFVDWLADAGQSWWQMLPLGPPDRHGSPYKARSAFAAWPGLLADPRAAVSREEQHAFHDRQAF